MKSNRIWALTAIVELLIANGAEQTRAIRLEETVPHLELRERMATQRLSKSWNVTVPEKSQLSAAFYVDSEVMVFKYFDSLPKVRKNHC